MAQFWKPGTEKPDAQVVDDEEGGVLFLPGSNSLSSSSGYGYASIEKQRQRLPVYKYRNAILYLVETHATTIIVGETGSGKTTQIPQVITLFTISIFKFSFEFEFKFKLTLHLNCST
jgi:ATP-dependent RNA helicase DDX35